METQELKIKALAQYLECEADEISETRHDDCLFDAPGGEYLVLTDEEADEKTAEYIKDSLWAFKASFILSECGLPLDLEEAIQTFQENKCESANDALLALVERTCTLDSFTQSAISVDGRGHFLATYDSNENEETVVDNDDEQTFYIYRTN
jgi:hypothetical protein